MVHLHYAAKTHQGQRPSNQDAFYANTYRSELDPTVEIGLFIVVDGIGVPPKGDQIAARVIEIITQPIENALKLSLHQTDIIAAIQAAVILADQTVIAENPEMGVDATLTLAVMVNNKVIIGHLGDTAAFQVTSTGLKPLTVVHDLTNKLIELGNRPPKLFVSYSSRNLLTMATQIILLR